MNQYIQIFVSLVIGIGSSVITSFISYKNAKTPNRENIAKNLLENFFAPNSEELELMLYHELDSTIKQKLVDLKNNHKQYLIYFSSDFTTILRQITEQDDTQLEVYQNKFNSLSTTYIKTLNKTRITLGLPRLSINYRIENNLFQSPKITKIFKNLKNIFEIFLLLLALTFVVSLFMLSKSPHFSLLWFSITLFSFTLVLIFFPLFCLFKYHLTFF